MEKTTGKIVSWAKAKEQVNAWKKSGAKVVFTNGCFDLVHLGHVDYLEKARNLGDKLILGLNSDSSVARFKGPERPLQDEKKAPKDPCRMRIRGHAFWLPCNLSIWWFFLMKIPR